MGEREQELMRAGKLIVLNADEERRNPCIYRNDIISAQLLIIAYIVQIWRFSRDLTQTLAGIVFEVVCYWLRVQFVNHLLCKFLVCIWAALCNIQVKKDASAAS